MKFSARPVSLSNHIATKQKPIRFYFTGEDMYAEELLDVVEEVIQMLPWTIIPLSEAEEIIAEIIPEHETTLSVDDEGNFRLNMTGHKVEFFIEWNTDETVEEDDEEGDTAERD
jgi:hypothetical protein